MRHSRFSLTLFVTAFCIMGNDAAAFDAEDLQRLKDTNSCVNCDLSEAMLSHQSLQEADLTGANLYRADLSFADLQRANFYYADLTEANLEVSVARVFGTNCGLN